MNEPMKVELGIWPLFAFLFNPAFWSGVATVTTSAGALMTVNSLVQSFSQPKTNSTSVEGTAAIRGISPEVATALQKQQTELERLNQEELAKVEEQKKLDEQITQTQKIQNIIDKYGPFVIVGGVVLGVVLLARRKK